MFGEWVGPDWNSQPLGMGDQNPLSLPIGMLMDFSVVALLSMQDQRRRVGVQRKATKTAEQVLMMLSLER